MKGHMPLVSPGVDLVPGKQLKPLEVRNVRLLIDSRRNDNLVEQFPIRALDIHSPLLAGIVACHAGDISVEAELGSQAEVVGIALEVFVHLASRAETRSFWPG